MTTLWSTAITLDIKDSINTSCRSSPNKYELVDTAYKKVGLEKDLFIKRFLSTLTKK